MVNVIIFSLAGGLFSLIGGVLLLRSKVSADKIANYATPFAAGALLAAAFLGLLTEAIHEASPDKGGVEQVLAWTLGGILIFFLMERFLHWFHHHHEHHNSQTDPAARLIVIGDTLHNALDGVAIAAAFLISPSTGIVATIAIAAHEIPQEIGDFGLLLKKGYSRKKVLLINALSALATTLTAVAVYAMGDAERLPLTAMLGLVAGFFIYIATSDIIPTIHEQSRGSSLFNPSVLLLLLGVVIVGIATMTAHNYIDPAHDAFYSPGAQQETEAKKH